jgi:hypothetical protein
MPLDRTSVTGDMIFVGALYSSSRKQNLCYFCIADPVFPLGAIQFAGHRIRLYGKPKLYPVTALENEIIVDLSFNSWQQSLTIFFSSYTLSCSILLLEVLSIILYYRTSKILFCSC